jgi:hypothetical protein
MKSVICILWLAAAFALSVTAFSAKAWTEPVHPGLSGTSDGVGFAAAPSLPQARAGRVRIYVKIKDFSCIQGGYLAIRLKKKWVAQIEGAGRYLVGSVKAGRKAKLYAEDATVSHYWGPKTFNMKPDWTWFVWTLHCY